MKSCFGSILRDEEKQGEQEEQEEQEEQDSQKSLSMGMF
jgi:hypothetical protein